jgi:hypothetical protein
MTFLCLVCCSPRNAIQATSGPMGQRLYQLVRLSGDVTDHTFEIRFLAPGATAYSFTFG